MSSRQMVQTYAKEAATLLLAEVERYTLPLEVAAGASHSSNSVDMQQLSLNEFSGGLRSIQTAPSGQHRPNRPHDTAWGWLVPGERVDSSCSPVLTADDFGQEQQPLLHASCLTTRRIGTAGPVAWQQLDNKVHAAATSSSMYL